MRHYLVRSIIIIFTFVKFFFRYFYKYNFGISFIFLLFFFIIVLLGLVSRYVFVQNKKFNNKNILISTEFALHPSVNIPSNNFYTNMICTNILKKYLYINGFSKEVFTYNYIVSKGDILSSIFTECNHIDISEITFLLQQYPILKNLKIGQMLSWVVTTNKKLQCLIWEIFPREMRVYNRLDTYFTEGIIKRINLLSDESLHIILFIGELGKTFIDSARLLGLEENYILNIVDALRYQVDFCKLRQGDRFSVLISAMINDNSVCSEFIGARLHTAGKDYYVFRANNGKLYDRDAVRLGEDFMCFPTLQPFRVSSQFNLHRLNPVTGQVSPHSGVDFAVPIGTPVISIGDGEVVTSRYSKVAGNYVVIKHNYNCTTRYMHLKKLLVKPGQKVKKGDYIALSGNTGRSTGPHLHFEIWINHHPVNPLTTKILNVEKLLGKEKIIYLQQIREILPKLTLY